MPQRDEDWWLSSLEQDILTLLLGRELYGLEMIEAMKTVGEKVSYPLVVGAGSLYPKLKEMEEGGLIVSQRRTAQRKYYSVTELGRRILNETRVRRQRLANYKPEV